MPQKRRVRGTGSTRQLASGRWQATFLGPDGIRRPAHTTFDTKLDARAWCDGQALDVSAGIWQPGPRGNQGAGLTLRQYAAEWLRTRELRPTTRANYVRLLNSRVFPELGDAPLSRLSPATIRRWHADQNASKATSRAHAYALLKSILATAVDEDLITSNPCRIRGGSSTKRKRAITPATPEEIDAMAAAMPKGYGSMVQVAAWCGPRSGELRELRRKDVDLKAGVLHISRAVTHVPPALAIVGPTKSDAGTREVHVPPHLLPMLRKHVAEHVAADQEALLWPSTADPTRHLPPSSLDRMWYPARKAAGREDMRWHDLRHTGATLAAVAGATLKETMARMGHSTPNAALLYQHASETRGREIADKLSDLAMRREPAV